MKIHHLSLYLLTSALAVSIQSKPHGKHESPHGHMQYPKEKDAESHAVQDEDDAVLPTFLPFEASSPEPDDEALNEETSNGKEKSEEAEPGALEGAEKNAPVLLSEEALTKLLQASEEEQQAMDEEREDEDDGEAEVGQMKKESMDSQTEKRQRSAKDHQKKKQVEVEELGSSTDSEIPVDLDYAADSEATDPLPSKLEETISENEDEQKVEDELPTAMEDYNSQQPTENAEESTEESQADRPVATESLTDEQNEPESDENKADEDDEEIELQDVKNRVEPADNSLPQEGEKETNESGNHTKVKGKKQKRTQRQRKVQSDQPALAEGPTEHLQNQEKEPESTLQKAKRRKNGKWSPLVGINPVQIRTTVELFPRTRPVVRPRLGADGQEVPADPCETFRCKRGKTCKLTAEKKPTCVCQEPADCPLSSAEFENVCGTDNQTYDTSCQLFATKCGLEGTKKGHRLHLDYTGSCKFIPPCKDTELVQFPLRMRDWLKNVLLQLYEHESVTPGFLTAKQRVRVQKLYESERRLHAGDHPIELLAQDFEKNYHMYIYPVHWQFAQMDQHPSDRFLSHSELAPLRVPLVPMEHCTSVFFQECDADKDKLVSFREWCQCFGIKDEDMDSKLLF